MASLTWKQTSGGKPYARHARSANLRTSARRPKSALMVISCLPKPSCLDAVPGAASPTLLCEAAASIEISPWGFCSQLTRVLFTLWGFPHREMVASAHWRMHLRPRGFQRAKPTRLDRPGPRVAGEDALDPLAPRSALRR